MAKAARFPHALRMRLIPWLAIAPAAVGMAAGVALPMAASAQEAAPLPPPPAMTVPAGLVTASTDHFRYIGAADGSTGMDPEAFAVAYGPALEAALAEAGAVAGMPRGRLDVVLFPDGPSLDAALAGQEEVPLRPSPVAADPPVGDLAVALEPLLSASPQEAEADLRHGVALVAARRAADWNLPRGFGEGFAAYAEHPSSARLARSAALVQDAFRRDATLTWSDLNRPRAVQGDPAVFAAHAYSVTAFLVERYGLRTYGEFLVALADEPDWRAAMRSVYQRAPSELEAQWRENLPRWTAGGWRDNLFAGFELEPARAAIETGRYAAAQRDLERSLRLFTDLGLTDNQAEAEPLLRQAERGLQAEALMGQVEQALGRHAYERADALLDEYPLAVGGGTVMACRRIGQLPDIAQEENGVTYRQAGARYEVEVRA